MPVPGERLKVVRIVARLNVGGPARQVTILSRDLVAAGFETLLVHGSLAHGEASLDCPVGDHVRVRQLPELGREIHPVRDFAALLRLIGILFADRPDIVDTHTSKAGAVGRLAAFVYNAARRRRHRCLVVHTFHGHVFRGYFGSFGNWAVRVAERSLARLTDVVVTISPAQRADIVERDDALVFGFVGRLVPIKDPATLLHAFATVRREIPRARLMMVGDGELRAPMELLAQRLGLADAVAFLGWRTDLVNIYAALDVLVLSSVSEGTPVAMIEAMAARKPVVATSVGGVPDLVSDGTTGLLVAPGDPGVLAEAMIRLARRPEARAAMGEAGRARSREYRADRLVTDTEELYRSELARKRGRPPVPCPATR
jgi:glycosyltransferase involved in cell wall biosynthesis